MSLDEERASTDAERAVSLVEAAIQRLGIDPEASRTERPGHVAFALRRGSARILIAVHAPEGERAEGRIRVVAPVVKLPDAAKHLDLFRWLLQANAAELVGAAFAVSANEVVVVAERSVTDLDASEVDSMIRNVGRIADTYDDQIADSFDAVRSSDA
jgi:hypothetical protein